MAHKYHSPESIRARTADLRNRMEKYGIEDVTPTTTAPKKSWLSKLDKAMIISCALIGLAWILI